MLNMAGAPKQDFMMDWLERDRVQRMWKEAEDDRMKEQLRERCEEYNKMDHQIIALDEGASLAESRCKMYEKENLELVASLEEARLKEELLQVEVNAEQRRLQRARSKIQAYRQKCHNAFKQTDLHKELVLTEELLASMQKEAEEQSTKVQPVATMEQIQQEQSAVMRQVSKSYQAEKQYDEEAEKIQRDNTILQKRNAALLLRLKKKVDSLR